MSDVPIIRIDDREYHMVHAYLAVVVPLRKDVETKIVTIAGEDYSRTVETWLPKQTDKPYLAYVDIRPNADGTYYLDDDDPIDNHWSAREAREMAQELINAAEYLEGLEAAL